MTFKAKSFFLKNTENAVLPIAIAIFVGFCVGFIAGFGLHSACDRTKKLTLQNPPNFQNPTPPLPTQPAPEYSNQSDQTSKKSLSLEQSELGKKMNQNPYVTAPWQKK